MNTVSAALVWLANAGARLTRPLMRASAAGEALAAPADAAYINAVCEKLKEASSLLGTTNLQILYGGSANQGLFEKIAQSVDGLFLGRSAHDVKNLKKIVEEVEIVALELAK